MIEAEHPVLSVRRQCDLLGLARSGLYYEPQGESAENLALMRLLDEAYTAWPFYGVRKMTAHLEREGQAVNVKRVRRLMRLMGLETIYPRKRLSVPGEGHKRYPYLLRGVEIVRPDQVWSADITYIRLRRGFLYLAAILDWYSRYVLSWTLSSSLDAAFCVWALEEALARGRPEVFNTDQGARVYERGVHGDPGFAGDRDQHGRARAGVRQHLLGATVADGEVRGGLSEGLRRPPRGARGTSGVLPVLRRAAATSGAQVPYTGGGVRGAGRRRTGPRGGADGCWNSSRPTGSFRSSNRWTVRLS